MHFSCTDGDFESILVVVSFPAACKISSFPLPKDGDQEIANNNRPVSLLPSASKICESVALNQLVTYMSDKKVPQGTPKWE